MHFEKTPRISLSCKLVPVQYREYENGPLKVSKWIKQLHFEYLEIYSVDIHLKFLSDFRPADNSIPDTGEIISFPLQLLTGDKK